jgi:hypothetical protein
VQAAEDNPGGGLQHSDGRRVGCGDTADSRGGDNAKADGKEAEDEQQEKGDEVRQTLTLKTGSVYYVMNITCIYLRAKDPNIYMYRMRRIYKKTPEEI